MTCKPNVMQSFPSSADICVQPLTTSTSTSCSFLIHQAPFKSTSQRPGAICAAAEEVTTIFVVGFPDDMTEREFQNMFAFSSGFEAASLKWHCKDQEDENGLPTTTSTRTSVHNSNGKKQMIGFARFRTRPEAIKAAAVMNGKRIDQERAVFIKAEMAKKNLHIKRGACGASTTATQGILPSYSDNNTQASTSPQPLQTALGYHPHESFSPLPSDLLSPVDYYKPEPFTKDMYCCSAPTAPIFSDGLFGIRNGSQENNKLGLVPSPSPHEFLLIPQPRMANTITQDSTIPVNGNTDPFCHHHCYFAKLPPVPNDHVFGPSSPPTDLPRCLSHSNSSCTSRSSSGIHHHYTGDFRSHLLSPSSLNPGDHNPPCNTLYVGNLAPTTDENELRELFCKCKAYKRMSFRNKAQGPMCFVEFEDVASATLAMNDLQGHMLSASVKGGIRLSFSKNPLFTRPLKDQKQTIEATTLFAFEGSQAAM